METDGLRRSGRIRKPVKTYAQEQAEGADELALIAPPPKRKKESAVTDITDDANDADFAGPSAEVDVTKATKKRGKKSKTTKQDADEEETAASEPAKKRKRASTTTKRAPADTSWHAVAAERKIAKAKSQIRKVLPGREEKRLRAFVQPLELL